MLEGWYSAAATLSGNSKRKPESAELKCSLMKREKLFINDQAEGVYLIVQSDSDERVSVSPMLLTVPFAEEETGWTYDVQAYPKAVTNDRKETQMQVTNSCFILMRILRLLKWRLMMQPTRSEFSWIKKEQFVPK